ncbi:hypothetical protein C5167_041743 [Papaver somniferum]|nr:hypothetical protein C5167_041743 [Papaver somniferum]
MKEGPLNYMRNSWKWFQTWLTNACFSVYVGLGSLGWPIPEVVISVIHRFGPADIHMKNLLINHHCKPKEQLMLIK